MRNYFCGWYFKCQSDDKTLAVISAVHGSSQSIQLITDDGAWSFTDNLKDNSFSKDGFSVKLLDSGASAFGEVRFGDCSTIKYDIMGPFKYVPFMECRHSIVSMRHRVDGMISVNDVEYRFDNDLGYIEGDRGYSFPREYAWTQCFFDDGNSLMFSIADIPIAGWHFTGIIGVILWQGKEYRFATYLGARALKIADNEFIIQQGQYRFTARLPESVALQ